MTNLLENNLSATDTNYLEGNNENTFICNYKPAAI